MRKRAIALLLAFLLLWLGVTVTDFLSTSVRADSVGWQTKAKSAVLIDAASGRVLFEQNARQRRPMASTTKIMTAMLTLEEEDLESYFTVDSNAIRVEGSSMGLREGDQVSLSALAVGMLLPSGNDAANAAAVRIAGSKQAFAKRMNERAVALELTDTHFVTPSGLDDAEHYSSAYDMAQLTRAALQNPRFAEICGQSKGVARFGDPPYDRWLANHNRLLKEYPGTLGVKTGFTDEAGRCLVSAVERDGVQLIAVTLSCPDDWNEHKKLYDHYFGLLEQSDPAALLSNLSAPVTGGVGGATTVTATYEPPEAVALLPGEKLQAKITLEPILFAPVARGQVIGRAVYQIGTQPVAETTLTAGESIPAATKEKNSLLRRLAGLFS